MTVIKFTSFSQKKKEEDEKEDDEADFSFGICLSIGGTKVNDR